ncbi:glycosyltransferase family 4 protein [Acidimangrovimonas sediminis]|uniref:glycosyltransferase family 4 protein n=1 Tax=Acidimangrovimonas sediminis TaxID=2056283 RepID=UPI000C800CC4|nr:glycosyltransferase [Acidimangrovimonas sediminis]
MKVVLSTVGRFHIFPLAREFEKLGVLERVYSGFPWSRLAREGVSRARVTTFPLVRPLLMGLRFLPFPVPKGTTDRLHQLSAASQDRFVARHMPPCDIFVGHEAVGLLSGREAQSRGALYVCDRGCSHIGWQYRLLDEEYARQGLPPPKRTPTLHRELAEYEAADLIVVASGMVRRSFLEEGFAPEKLAVIPYGVNVERFHPVGAPDPARFDILFVGALSVRKGARDLLTAFHAAKIPNKRLRLAGAITDEIRETCADLLDHPAIEILGHVPHERLKEVMSTSHLITLPSIEDGFGMVVAEAMACGCPAVVSENTGAADIVEEGVSGFVVPIRAPEVLAERFERIAAAPELRQAMSEAALARVAQMGGWSAYGEAMRDVFLTALERLPQNP